MEVLNRRKLKTIPANAIYVGRPTKWGNPFSHIDGTLARFKVPNREQAVMRYRRWVCNQPHLMSALKELKGKNLVCWCAPLPCHANVLLQLANGKNHE